MKKIIILILITGITFQSFKSYTPKIKSGEFYIKSTINNKILEDDEVTIYYHLRKGEDVKYFSVIFSDYYYNQTVKYYKPIKNDSLLFINLKIPNNYCFLYVIASGNMNCATGGYSSADYIIYDNKGKLKECSVDHLLSTLYNKRDTIHADSIIKVTLKKNPDNYWILNNYFTWLSNGSNYKLLEKEIEKIKKDNSKNKDEKLALISEGYKCLKETDSMLVYLEKYIEESSFPGFASSLLNSLDYLLYDKNIVFEKREIFEKRISQKCPLSESADYYLFNIISKKERDSLAEKIILEKIKNNSRDYYFQAMYNYNNLKDKKKAYESALKYLEYSKELIIPFDQSANLRDDAYRLTKIYELLAEISENTKLSYNYILLAIESNTNINDFSDLYARASEYAFRNGDIEKSDEHLIQICKQGKLEKAKNTIQKLYPNDNVEEKLIAYFKKSALLCETIPDLKIKIDSINSVSTNDKKILFLNLWSPYCAPCIKEIPLLNKLRSKYSTTDIVWLARDFGYKYMSKLPTKYIGWSLYQRNDSLNKIFFKEPSVPQIYIVDKNKKIRYHQIGARQDESTSEIELILDLLLKEN